MIEYKIVEVFGTKYESVEKKLNAMAQDGWSVVCAIGADAIIMERIIDEGALLAEEVIRRQFSYSFPDMVEAKDVV
jgi:hypothetical protein